MSCERYWREGILLVERNAPDPHRATCDTCQREHSARDQLVRAMRLVVDVSDGDAQWKARVWTRIARFEPPSSRWRRLLHRVAHGRRFRQRPWWQAGTAFALACAVWLILRDHRGLTVDGHTYVEVLSSGSAAERTTLPHVGDRIQITVRAGDEIRVYRADRLVLRCSAQAVAAGCTAAADRTVAQLTIAAPGGYQLVVITPPTAPPAGSIELDLRDVVQAGGEYRITDLPVW